MRENVTMYFVTTKSLTFMPYGNQFVIGSGTKQKLIEDEKLFGDVVKISRLCISRQTKENVYNYISESGINKSSLDFMLDNGFITCQDIDLENRYSIYYEALGINPLSLQKELENRTIVIDGCGGIGNMMSYTLCSMGIKKLILLDNDIVEESNLNRQFLFTKKDVGRRKVDVLREALIERSTDTEIVSIYKNVDYGYEKVEGHMDLVILSADGDMSMQVTNAYCVENRIPYINAGYLSDISIIGPFYIPDITACAMCHEDMYGVKNLGIFPEKAVYVNKKMKAPSMAANNFIASGMATVDIIYYFSGKYALINSLEKRMGINNRDFSRLSVDFRRNENCSICSDYKKSFSDTPFNKRVAV